MMKAPQSMVRCPRGPQSLSTPLLDICFNLSSLRLSPRRCLHTSMAHSAAGTRRSTATEMSPPKSLKNESRPLPLTPEQRAEAVRRRAAKKMEEDQREQEQNVVRGSLARSSAFGNDLLMSTSEMEDADIKGLEARNATNMAYVLNPRPGARARWQRRMVIREVRRRGRLTKEMKIARSERQHLAKSHFFKTSVKKLAPLARQIAGKSLDEAILQMRFSKKKVAQDIRQHLVQARNEATVMKGMGAESLTSDARDPEKDPSENRPAPHQTPSFTYKKGHAPKETDIYIAEAWANRGPYKQLPDYRARGRFNLMRPPHTGISVLLKEEKTRTRIRVEKEAKAIRRRMGKSMWVHLPDRPVTTQRQHVLW